MGKIYIITGVNGNLGKELINRYCEDKNNIIIAISKNDKEVEYPDNVRFCAMDLTKSCSYEDLYSVITNKMDTEEMYDEINVIHCAGIYFKQFLNEFCEEEYLDMYKLHCIALIRFGGFLLDMRTRYSKGNIITISTSLTRRMNSNTYGYVSSKAAGDCMVRQLANDLGKYNISVNGVASNYFGEMENQNKLIDRKKIIDNTPLQRLTTVDDICSTIEFLLNSKVVTGEILLLDGGNTIGY